MHVDCAKQNAFWYELFREHEEAGAVVHAHRSYLLTRDLTIMCAIYFIAGLVTFGYHGVVTETISASLVSIWQSPLFRGLMLFLFIQFFVVRLAAQNYGEMLVTNVLAEVAVSRPRLPPQQTFNLRATKVGDGWHIQIP